MKSNDSEIVGLRTRETIILNTSPTEPFATNTLQPVSSEMRTTQLYHKARLSSAWWLVSTVMSVVKEDPKRVLIVVTRYYFVVLLPD